MKNINICIVGLGKMGERYIQICKKLNFKIIAIVDVNKAKLIKIKKKYELTNCNYYTSLSLMYNRCKINCIIISSTADTHFRFAKKAIENKTKYILIEKPLCVSVNQCEKLIQLRNKSISKIAVNHQMRFMKKYNRVKKMINENYFGGLKSMHVIGANLGMLMNGIHFFEAFRYLSDEKVIGVEAWLQKGLVQNPRGKKFKDFAGCIKLHTKSGKRFYMDISNDQGIGIEVIYFGKNGIIKVDELTGEMTLKYRKMKFIKEPTTKYALPYKLIKKTVPADIEYTDFFNSVKLVLKNLIDNKETVPIEAGLNTIQIFVAAYNSSRNSNKYVSVNNLKYYNKIFPWA